MIDPDDPDHAERSGQSPSELAALAIREMNEVRFRPTAEIRKVRSSGSHQFFARYSEATGYWEIFLDEDATNRIGMTFGQQEVIRHRRYDDGTYYQRVHSVDHFINHWLNAAQPRVAVQRR